MLEFDGKVKKWGNSFGLIIPKDKLNGIKENDEIHVLVVKKNNVLKETFGMFKGWKMNGQKAKDMIRRDLHGFK